MVISKKCQYQAIASIRVPGRCRPEKVVRIGIGYAAEKRPRIVRCCIKDLSFSVNVRGEHKPSIEVQLT